ncbi:MAG TPA: serine hydrolase domain-containing protein [Acidimicrobiales bacterium]|nr:serine hydrolase domain-containing protein [Acidimicrobiales bacterium]
MSTDVDGHVEPGFEAVRDAFAQNFADGLEVGASYCVHVEGEKVVDLWGGSFDAGGSRPYGPDTLQIVYSTTKGATAMCANLLAERGELDVDAPVATYWPEFAQAGKDELPVLSLLTHQAGLPTVDRTLSAAQVQAWEPMIEALAAQAPYWEPGTAHGYHAVTYGHLVGEVVRRVTGRSLGTFFAEEFARPLGIEFFIGLPEELEDRVAPIIGGLIPEGTADAPGLPAGFDFASTLVARALNPGGAFFNSDFPNSRAWHAAEVPAANGITNAASLSRLYAGLIGPVEGGPPTAMLSAAQVERARLPRTSGADQVFLSLGLEMDQTIGLGFWTAGPFALFGAPGSFGHAGAGGSYGFADPDNRVAVGYTMNKMSTGITTDPRSRGLVQSTYAAIGVDAKYI